MSADREAAIPLTRAAADTADAELQAEFARLNPELARKAAMLALHRQGLEAELAAARADLAAEKRDRALWAANNSRERRRAAEQNEKLREALRGVTKAHRLADADAIARAALPEAAIRERLEAEIQRAVRRGAAVTADYEITRAAALSEGEE